MFQAITDISEDRNSVKLGLTEETFVLPISKFDEFLKAYKKLVTESKIDGNDVIIKTELDNITFESKWTDADTDKLNSHINVYENLSGICCEDNLVRYYEFTEKDINAWLNEKPSRFFLTKENGNIELSFDIPERGSDTIVIGVLPSYLGKVVRTSGLEVSVYHQMKDDISLYYSKITISNGKFITEYYGRFINYLEDNPMPEVTVEDI
jgi:hypothetical protein